MTLGVVALAAALVVPRLPDLRGLALDAAAARLADALGAGRERAILGGARWRLVVDLDAGRWTLGRLAADGRLEAPPGPLGEPVSLPPSVRVLAVHAPDAPAVARGVATVDLAPEGDALPARIELGDDRGRVAAVVLPPAAARAVIR